MTMNHDLSHYISKWMTRANDLPVVMSSRIRLARNIQKYVHPLMYPSEEMGFSIINDIQDALPSLKLLRLDTMDQQSKLKLVAKHLVSPSLIKQPASAVMVNEDESISVMLNEEDHVRIQAMDTDLVLEELFEKASEIDDLIDEKVDYSYDEQLGYLTTCPTNIGTGLRASVMLHLPGLSIMNRMNRIAQTINRFGFTIRGIYGEGSKVYGHMYQVSNQLTLGKSEREIIRNLNDLIHQIINEEMQVRARFETDNYVETLDRINRSLGILKYSHLISMEEASFRLSEIKLGIDLGYINIENFRFNELMVSVQSPFLIDDEDERSIDEKRASVLRSYFN